MRSISLSLAVLLHLFVKLCLLCEIVVSDNYSFASSYKQPSCHDDEKSALLQFKKSFIIDKYSSSDEGAYPKVLQWNKNASNCCMWDGVRCDKETSHVIELDVSSSCLFGSINFNSTLFNLLHLRRLNLADNDFNYSQIPSALKKFPSLNYLNLSQSRFFGQVPIEISYLSNLAALDLSLNFYGDSEVRFLKLRNPVLSNLTNLEFLHLGSVDMSSAVPIFLKNFSSLVSLDLENCDLYGEFPAEIFQLPNLQALIVSANENLTGYLPEFHQNNPLKHLQLEDTRFSGSLPSSIENLHSLEYFSVQRCHFSGPIPSSLGKLTKLTILDLRRNSLIGHIPSSLQNLTRLIYLALDNQKSDPILSWIGNLTQLVVLSLHQNEFHGTIPQSLSKLTNLKLLSLAADNLGHGMVKFDVFLKMKSLSALILLNINLSFQFEKGNMNASLPKFKALIMSSCNLIEFPNFLGNRSKLKALSLAGNMLRGPLPIPPPSIKEFDASDNMLSGEIPPHYCNLTSLNYLRLCGNNLSGEIPACLVNPSHSMSVIRLGRNSFHGIIPEMCKNGGNLEMLDLSDNKLQGLLPRSLSNCKKFQGLIVSKNQLIDVFPSWLGALPYLRFLVLSHNGFYGAIGKVEKDLEFTKLQVMDLSFNNFVGELPSEYISSLNSMKHIDMVSKFAPYMNFEVTFHVTKDFRVSFTIVYEVKVTFKGRETYRVIQNNFALIDLSSNKFEGEIPELVGNLTSLCSLNLSNNMLTGNIPTSLGNLKELESLDLSNNNLSGKIPQQMNELTFLAYLNVSHNNLIGPIPQGTQFSTFGSNSFEGNLGLCGKPLLNKCGNLPALPPSHAQELESPIELDRKFVWVGILSGLVVGGILGDTVTRRNRAWTRLVEKFRWMLQERF
ncbi:receptor-like protein 9DC3 [Ziziphus jujuba]|uniref:Receptor-like protein 9DC3 n=1 Tax=Ziziphus jujuba TaxID=326968 RepID=A0ABM3IQX7_ZIZJJ|nr:receptor-like protein 9DC3 [Ziziphus jujuba]